MFERLLGQNFIKNSIGDAVASGREGHAYVFCGPDGIGRKSFAAEFAKALLCTAPGKGGEACGNCPACRLTAAGTNPDYTIVRGEENRATVGVETVRQLEEDIATAPTVSRRKIYVIDRSEKLTPQAQNALLKTIEEPPEYVMIILICSNPSLLIDTVRSRVLRLDFARNTPEEVLAAYRSSSDGSGGRTLSAEDEEMIVSYSDGIIGRALAFRDFGLFEGLRSRLFDVLMLLKNSKGTFMRRFTDFFSDKSNAEYRDFLFFELTSIERDVAVFLRFGNAAPLQNTQFRNKITELSEAGGLRGWEKAADLTAEAYRLTGQNVNFRSAVANLAAGIAGALA